MRKPLLWFLCTLICVHLSAQNRTITGTIKNEEGTPLLGASVIIKGTKTGTSADEQGRFTISVPSSARVLVISSVNYAPQEVSLTGASDVSVTLRSSSSEMTDVVVIAYGTQSKKKSTGAQVKISGDQFSNVPMPSVDQMLQGKAAGLQSVATSGQPGALGSIRIRGIGSFNTTSTAANPNGAQASEPLFVIDGIPVISGDASRLTNSSNMLAGINPNDIQDITVLKDASATAIYGSRASNGVILITTKTGKSGKTRFMADAEMGTNDIAFFPDLAKPLNRQQLKDLTLEGLKNVGASATDIDNIINQYGYNSTADYNWMDLVSRHGQQNQFNVSASGGNANATFFLSGGYFRQQSPVIGSDFKRYNGSFNGSLKASNKLNFSAGVNVSTFKQNGESEGTNFRNPILTGLALRPSQEAFKADGTPEYSTTIYEQVFNPLAIQKYDRTENNTTKLLGNVAMEYKIIPDLSFRSKYGIDYANIEENRYLNPYFGDARTATGSFNVRYRRLFNYVWSNTLEYARSFVDGNLDATLLAGHESQKTKDFGIYSQGEGLPLTTAITFPGVSTPITSATTPPVLAQDNSIESYFSRLLLSYNTKYNLSLSIRRDGSSRFATDSRWGTFWSVGGSWNIDQESFMPSLSFLSGLKLRASVGTTGNNRGIGDYDWRPLYTFAGNYNGQTASSPDNVGNLALTWEKNDNYDLGLEGGFFNNRVTFDLGYYYRKTFDLLLDQPLSRTSGFSNYNNNIGSMRNSGIELQASFTPLQTKNITWNIGINAAWNKNKVLSLSATRADIISLPYIRRIGEDFQAIYTRLWAGADPANGNPLWYTDSTKKATTSSIGTAQRTIIGTASPKGFGGVNTSFRYKNFTVSGQLNFQYGNLVNTQSDFIFTSDGAFPNLNRNQKQLRRWQKPGDVTDVPRYDFNNATSSNSASSRYFFKGDFMRLRNVSLSYDFSKRLLEKIKIEGASLYVRGTNLWTKVFDDDLTVDPEQPINGAASNQFFIPKAFTAGINLSF